MANRYQMIVLAAVIGFATGGAVADFGVKQVTASQEGGKINIDTRLTLALSEAAERALSHGISLVILSEFELVRTGFPWPHVLDRKELRYELSFHALSAQYVLQAQDAEFETFETLNDALDAVSVSRVSFVAPGEDAIPDDDFNVKARSRLDIDSLPNPLRTRAWFSPQWRLSTDWTTWSLKP